MARVLRYANAVYKHIRPSELRAFVSAHVGTAESGAALLALLSSIPEPSSEEEESKSDDPAKPERKTFTAASAPERAFYVGLLAALLASRHGLWDVVEQHARRLCAAAVTANRRSLDLFHARCLSLLGLAAERCGRLGSLRNLLLASHRTSVIRHDSVGQAVAINLVLRGLVTERQFLQARRLIESVEHTLPLDSSAQLVRFLFYKGRVLAVCGEYAAADACLGQALRKAPASTARGFKQLVQKHCIVVELLRGIVPERSVFSGMTSSDGSDRDRSMIKALEPYLHLTQEVRKGNVEAFGHAVEEHRAQLLRDDTLSLVQRLRRTVIRSGLRKITSAYSAITFKDIASRLRLPSPEDAEFLCAKAIREGVINAELDHDRACLVASSAEDVYATSRPKEEFHRRIEFCLDIHAEAVRSMRYPPGAFRKDEAALMEARRREEEEAAVAKAIEDSNPFLGGDDDDGDDDEDM
jgi:26S proteasome regulatory subunit N3